MAQSAQKWALRLLSLIQTKTVHVAIFAHQFIHANYDDEQALKELGESSDVITYEFENISSQQLKQLTENYNIPQGYQAIQLLQDRLTEKQTLKDAGTQIVPFLQIKINKIYIKLLRN